MPLSGHSSKKKRMEKLVFYIMSISCWYCQYPAAMDSTAILQLPEANKNHHFWFTLQINWNPKYQMGGGGEGLCCNQIKKNSFPPCFSLSSFRKALENIVGFVCLSPKLCHVSIILNAINHCISSSSFPLIFFLSPFC